MANPYRVVLHGLGIAETRQLETLTAIIVVHTQGLDGTTFQHEFELATSCAGGIYHAYHKRTLKQVTEWVTVYEV